MTQPDPGNSSPEEWCRDLTEEEARDAYAAVEEFTKNLTVEVSE